MDQEFNKNNVFYNVNDIEEKQAHYWDQLKDMPDEGLVERAQNGDNDALEYMIERYKYYVKNKARSYFLIGADHEDLVQEGTIGLFKAIRDYKKDKLSSFRGFAELCITRQMITAIKTATRQKHGPLNSYVSLNKPIYTEDSEKTLLDIMVENNSQNPEDMMINEENIDLIRNKVKKVLSPLEQKALNAYLDGKSYQEIAEMLNRHVKSIDNALQRVKKKLENSLIEIRNERFK